MEIDDSEAHRLYGELGKNDLLVQAVVKCHLIVEHQLNEIIAAQLHSPPYFRESRLSFAQKIALSRAIIPKFGDHEIWNLVKSVNSLRNSIVHGSPSSVIENKSMKALDVFEKISKRNLEVSEKDDYGERSVLVTHVFGFISGFLENLIAKPQPIREGQLAPKMVKLDGVGGIGPARKRALLAHFGSAKVVSAAAVTELETVEGISKTMAQKIYDHFHREG